MKRKALFLDRDGVINLDRAYVGRQEDFTFMPDVFPVLRAAQDRGYRLVVVTNQSGVARGYYTEAAYESLTFWMRQVLLREGITLDAVLACFEHPDATVAAYKRESFWRKPQAGMLLEATQRFRLDPARSVLIGDQPRDLEAAEAAGIAKRLWLTDSRESPSTGGVVIHALNEAVAFF